MHPSSSNTKPSGLVVSLSPIRNAIAQAQRLGRDEPQQSIVARIVGDIREGHHPYREAADRPIERRQWRGRSDAA